jgi:hypothetical protein
MEQMISPFLYSFMGKAIAKGGKTTGIMKIWIAFGLYLNREKRTVHFKNKAYFRSGIRTEVIYIGFNFPAVGSCIPWAPRKI